MKTTPSMTQSTTSREFWFKKRDQAGFNYSVGHGIEVLQRDMVKHVALELTQRLEDPATRIDALAALERPTQYAKQLLLTLTQK